MPRYLLLVLSPLLLLAGCGGTKTLDPEEPRARVRPAVDENDIAVYFSPKGGALQAILDELNAATRSVDVMAYLITAKEIVDALESAQKRGVSVRVLMDGGDFPGVFSDKAIFANSPVPIWRDDKHKEFHHKVMLIDGRVVITGSFNFTSQAEQTNAENLLLIRNRPKVYSAYLSHFNEHLGHSKPPEGRAVSEK